MKTLVVVCALVACCTAAPQSWGYSSIDTGLWGNTILSPNLLASRTIAAPLAYSSLASHYASPYAYSYAAPAVVTKTVGAPVLAAAPAVAVTRTLAAAPIVAAAPTVAVTRTLAPAPVVAATPVVTKTLVAAPALAVTRAVAAPVVAAPAPIVAAAPAPIIAAAPSVVAVAPAVTKTQYHSQDELGQAFYGHAEPLQTHNAVQDAHGNKVGSFSYLNPHDGQIHRTDYVADALGYRVAANDLPIDTPEVAIAKAAHLSAHAAARSKRSVLAVAETPASTTPLATHVVAAPVAYSTLAAAPLAYSAPVGHLAYSAPVGPLAYSAPVGHLAYSAPVGHLAYSSIAAPLAYSAPISVAPAVRAATLTTVHNNPGHAVSYRVD